MKKIYAVLMAQDTQVEIFYKKPEALSAATQNVTNGHNNVPAVIELCAAGFRKGTGIKPKLGVVYEIDMAINRVAKVSL